MVKNKEWKDAEKMANNPAGSIGEETTENKKILQQIQDLALRYAKGTMTKLEEETDGLMRAERAVSKMLNKEQSDD